MKHYCLNSFTCLFVKCVCWCCVLCSNWAQLCLVCKRMHGSEFLLNGCHSRRYAENLPPVSWFGHEIGEGNAWLSFEWGIQGAWYMLKDSLFKGFTSKRVFLISRCYQLSNFVLPCPLFVSLSCFPSKEFWRWEWSLITRWDDSGAFAGDWDGGNRLSVSVKSQWVHSTCQYPAEKHETSPCYNSAGCQAPDQTRTVGGVGSTGWIGVPISHTESNSSESGICFTSRCDVWVCALQLATYQQRKKEWINNCSNT